MDTLQKKIVILDFGSQYTQLIARRIRESRVYCEILPFDASSDSIFSKETSGIILSGSPSSISQQHFPTPDLSVFNAKIPILGICYGYQLLGWHAGIRIRRAEKREYGPTEIAVMNNSNLFKGLDKGAKCKVWMSHSDILPELPRGFEVLAVSPSSPYAAIACPDKAQYGVQFHPEVTHSNYGTEILRNFALEICRCNPVWTPEVFIENAVNEIRTRVGNGHVICGLSGGVDSAVVSLLLERAIGNQMTALFIDNGILRQREAEDVCKYFTHLLGHRFKFIDASQEFISALMGVDDPEQKRKIIGNTFIHVFEREASAIGNIDFLAQGTLYPDVIESTSV
ncbi:glutamine-hydrolyzing GMP synthase, partial [bacterium]|nr:glutamine-hydrolyzing GMP synthase [candidate division CSSED10-310 bacterium]